MTTDKFKNLRIFRERIATLESLSDAYKAKALAGIDKILSDEDYAKEVRLDYPCRMFGNQFWWIETDEGEKFWEFIALALRLENKHIIEE